MSPDDHARIHDLLADLAWGPDLLELERYRRCFADELEVVNPTFADGPGARRMRGDDWARRVITTQSRFPVRRHVLSGASIRVHGERAEVLVRQTARFAASAEDPDALEVSGPLRLSLHRAAGRWQVVRLHYEVLERCGDPGRYRDARAVAGVPS